MGDGMSPDRFTVERIAATAAFVLVGTMIALLWTGPQGHPAAVQMTPTALVAVSEAPAVEDAPDPAPTPTGAPAEVVVTSQETAQEAPRSDPTPAPSAVATEPPKCPYPAILALGMFDPQRTVLWDEASPADRAACPAPWVPAIASGGEPAVQIGPSVWVCWDEHAYPLNQSWPTCRDGWGPRTPENPIPIGVPPRRLP